MAALLLALTLASPAMAQDGRRRSGPTMKVGFNRQMLSGYTYTLEDTGTTTEYTNSDPMQGNEISMEYVFFDRMGFEVGVGVTPLARNYELTMGATKVTVEEKARTLLYGANLYFNGASGNGFKFLAGLNTGRMTVSHSFDGAGSAVDQKSSTVPITLNGIKLGFEWLSDNAGARLTYGTLTGGRKVKNTPVAAWDQTYAYTAAMLTLGIFAFF